LTIVSASTDVLAAQRHRQAVLRFLLDPTVTLVNVPHPETAEPNCDLPQTIGLKFRYLRSQTGQSVKEMTQRVGVAAGTLSALELGQRVPLLLYLTYLETLGVSWENFAALELPPELIQDLQSPHLALRLCPTPACPNHRTPPSMRVIILRDLPERRAVRLRCTSCGRRFTRSYNGQLMTKPRRPPIRPGEQPSVVKSADEIARLIEMGLQGKDNRQIARHLGWGEKTVRMYWIALDLEERVHHGQAQRRAQEKQERRAALRVRIEAILQPLLNQDEEITLRRIGQVLGRNSDYLNSYPELAGYVRKVIRQHNAQVRQRRYEALLAHITHIIQALKHSNEAMTIEMFSQQVGLSYKQLRKRYPELHAMVRQAVQEHRARITASRIQAQIAQINEAAARLVAQGTRLTYETILKEAGLSEHSDKCPVVRERLQRWTGSFAPRD